MHDLTFRSHGEMLLHEALAADKRSQDLATDKVLAYLRTLEQLQDTHLLEIAELNSKIDLLEANESAALVRNLGDSSKLLTKGEMAGKEKARAALRKQVEKLPRYSADCAAIDAEGVEVMAEYEDGYWLSRNAVLALFDDQKGEE